MLPSGKLLNLSALGLFFLVALSSSPSFAQYGLSDLEGYIDDIDLSGQRFQIVGRWVAVDDSTEIMAEFDWTEQELAQHMRGSLAYVWGNPDSVGVFHARFVLLSQFHHVGGPVEEITDTGCRILDLEFQFAPQFQVYLGHLYRKPIPTSDLAPGDIGITSWKEQDGIRSTGFIIKMLPYGSVSAPVESVVPEENLIRVGGVNVRGTEWLTISTWNGQPVHIADLQPGQCLATGPGEMYAPDSLIVERATLIEGNEEMWTYCGVIQSVGDGDSTVTMMGIDFGVDALTMLFDKAMNPLPLADLEEGAGFNCGAVLNADSVLTLRTGFQTDPMDSTVSVRGSIHEIDLERKRMRVGEIELTFTEHLYISLLGMEGFEPSDLMVNLNADVSGILRPGGIEATSLRIEPSSAIGNHKVEQVDLEDSLLTVFGQHIKIMEKSILREKYGNSEPVDISFASISISDSVYVQGNFIPPDTLGAFIVTVLKEPVGIDDGDPEAPPVPRTVELGQNYPNPSNPATTIEFRIGSQENKGAVDVRLDIYDIRGRKVRALLNDPLPSGNYRVAWDGRNERGVPVPSGIYLYRLSCAGTRIVRRMAVLR
jgi:hypothetical protein